LTFGNDGMVTNSPWSKPANATTQVGGVVEIGGYGFHHGDGLRFESRGQCVQSVAIARHEDQVVAAARQAVRVQRANAGGCARDQCGALVCLSVHGLLLSEKEADGAGEGSPPASRMRITSLRIP
jgi:hypothetical protein